MKNRLVITKAENGFIVKKQSGKIYVYQTALDIIKTMADDIEHMKSGIDFAIEFETNGAEN